MKTLTLQQAREIRRARAAGEALVCADCGGSVPDRRRIRCVPCNERWLASDEYRERQREYTRKSQQKKTTEKLPRPPVTCVDCAEVFQPSPFGRPPKTCGPCRKARSRLGNRDRAREAMRIRRAEEPEAVREAKRRHYDSRRGDPEWVAMQRAAGRETQARRRAEELYSLGNPTHCGVCEKLIKPLRDGRDGRCVDHRHDNDVVRGVVCHVCNHKLAVMDLRFTDPALWQRLSSWSLIGEPVAPTGRKRANVRRMPEEHPVLFEVVSDDSEVA